MPFSNGLHLAVKSYVLMRTHQLLDSPKNIWQQFFYVMHSIRILVSIGYGRHSKKERTFSSEYVKLNAILI